MSGEHPHLGGCQLLPPKPGTCAECAVAHAPEQPHNQESMFYQNNFYGKHGRWPTWKDALEHCSPEVKARWTLELKAHGVEVVG